MRKVALILLGVYFSVTILTATIANAGPIRDQTGLHINERKTANSNGTGQAKPKNKSSADRPDETKAAAAAKLRKAEEKYVSDTLAYESCMATANTVCAEPAPAFQQFGGQLQREPDAATPIDPTTAAYLAVARLRLTAPTPVIGPPPTLNKWKMAAVGYPLWLSVAGQTQPAPVSDSVAGLRVSLAAHLSKVTFDMGDGHRVSCTRVTDAWTASVKAGAKSPSCGYSYVEPSLPKGNYSVVATTYWSVAWSTTTQNGVIPYVQTAAVELPVGELQVLVR